MALSLQPIRWPGDDESAPHDFRVLNEGKPVGRIYRRNSSYRESWNWTIYGKQASGLADTLELAKVAFKSAWEDGGLESLGR
jgi:hypothetical protein